MKTLVSFPLCQQCISDMAHTASKMAAGADTELGQIASDMAHEALDEALKLGLTSPEVANRVMREIEKATGVKDPYAEFKIKEMALAQRAYEQAAGYKSTDLGWLLSLAVLGNSLDFFKNPEEAMAQIQKLAQKTVAFHHDDGPILKRALEKKPKLLLYLTDNAGEIYFDLPLYDYLRTQAQRVVLVVKGGPGLNDLTRADLDKAGLSQRFDEVADTGTGGAGIEWQGVSPEFLGLLSQADLVLAKGMANFETMYGRDLKPPVLFLFKLKCRPLRDFLNAPPDSYWALWQEGEKGAAF